MMTNNEQDKDSDVKDSVVDTHTVKVISNPNQSEEISQLAKALCEAQKTDLFAITDSENPFFKTNYADLSSVWNAIRRPLTENGLAVIQTVESGEKGITVATTLVHTSGEYVRSSLTSKPDKATLQGMGSAITYLRRYALSAMVGVCPVDDDAEIATDRNKKVTPDVAQKKKTPNPPAKKFPDHRKDVAPPTPPDEPDAPTGTPPAKKKAKHTNAPAKKDDATQEQTDTSASKPMVIHDLPKGKKLIPINFSDTLAEYPIDPQFKITMKTFDDAKTHHDVNGTEVWTDGNGRYYSAAPKFSGTQARMQVDVVDAVLRFGIDKVKQAYPNVSLFGED